MRIAALAILLCLSCGATLAPSVAHAQRALNLQEAAERVQSQTGGRILSAETVRIGRTKVYRIKVLTREGRVRVVQVPAAGPPTEPRQGDGA
jgi:hypothetical protein